MKMQDIKNMDRNDMLGMLGLQAKRSDTSQVLKALGTFGIGLVVGAGVALLLAPKAGSELRHDLRAKFRRDGKDDGDALAGNGSANVGAGAGAGHSEDRVPR
jgi:hypothetical protein